jgi:hypothetical protein
MFKLIYNIIDMLINKQRIYIHIHNHHYADKLFFNFLCAFI